MTKPYYQNNPNLGLVKYIDSLPSTSKLLALDVGCGPGQNTFYLLSKGFNVDAINKWKSDEDLFKSNLFKNKQDIESSDSKLWFDLDQDMFSFDFEKNKYDLIVCTSVLHFYEKDQQFSLLEKILPALKVNGKLIVSNFTNLRDGMNKDTFHLLKHEEYVNFFRQNSRVKILSETLEYESVKNAKHSFVVVENKD